MNIFLRTAGRRLYNPTELRKRLFSASSISHAAEGRIGYPSERYEPTTISALDKDNKRLPLITGLYDDGFLVAGQDRIVGAIFSFPRQIICWNVRASAVFGRISFETMIIHGSEPRKSAVHRNRSIPVPC